MIGLVHYKKWSSFYMVLRYLIITKMNLENPSKDIEVSALLSIYQKMAHGLYQIYLFQFTALFTYDHFVYY